MSQDLPRRVSLMITCLADLFFPEVGVRIVRLLRGLGVAVDFPAGQTCCGLPLLNSGYHVEAAAVARLTLGLFEDSMHVVVPSGSCAGMVKHEYPALMPDAGSQARAQRLADRTWELSQFLVEVLGQTRFATAVPGRVTDHDSCHLLRGLGEQESPRTILGNLEGVEMVELPGSDECCGFGGSFRCVCPRCPPPSSTRSWPRWRPPGPIAPHRGHRAHADPRGPRPRRRARHLRGQPLA